MTIRDQVINFVEKQGEVTRKDIIRFIVCDIKHGVTKKISIKTTTVIGAGIFQAIFHLNLPTKAALYFSILTGNRISIFAV